MHMFVVTDIYMIFIMLNKNTSLNEFILPSKFGINIRVDIVFFFNFISCLVYLLGLIHSYCFSIIIHRPKLCYAFLIYVKLSVNASLNVFYFYVRFDINFTANICFFD